LHAHRRQQPVAAAIDWGEHELRTRAKHRDARWTQLKKVSLMNYGTAVALGVTDRIVDGLVEECIDVARAVVFHPILRSKMKADQNSILLMYK
jgi:hypothetical protein